MRKVARWIALALVAVAAVLGVPNAIDELGEGETFLQKSVGVAVTVYAIVSWLILFAVWKRRAWAVSAAVVWALATIWAASVATFSYGDAPWGAVLASGGSCALLGAWIIWAVRDSVRAPEAPVASPETRV